MTIKKITIPYPVAIEKKTPVYIERPVPVYPVKYPVKVPTYHKSPKIYSSNVHKHYYEKYYPSFVKPDSWYDKLEHAYHVYEE